MVARAYINEHSGIAKLVVFKTPLYNPYEHRCSEYTQTDTVAQSSQMTIRQAFVRAYLRASTDTQDANRAREALNQLALDNGVEIAAWYVESASGAKSDRTELLRLLSDAKLGDVMLIEQVDRLARLTLNDWDVLKAAIKGQVYASSLWICPLAIVR